MHRKTIHRGIAVLTVAAALSLAGARPAAAEEPELFSRGWCWLAFLWEPLVRQAPETYARAMAASPGKSANPGPTDKIIPGDKGLGVDPNGNL